MDLINPAGMPAVARGYAHGTAVGDWVFVSGQLPVDSEGSLVGPGDIEAQTAQVIRNVASVLAETGLKLTDITMVTAYLKDFADYDGYVRAYLEGFGSHTPARATVGANLVREEFLVEIQAIAMRTPDADPASSPTR